METRHDNPTNFFRYNGKVINLNNVAEFKVRERGEQDVELEVIFNYSHGFWQHEELEMKAETSLGIFQSADKAYAVVADILAGYYDNIRQENTQEQIECIKDARIPGWRDDETQANIAGHP